jgi:hypothetical protein
MIDSNKFPNCRNQYLYKYIEKRYELRASPNGRYPIGKKEKFRVIAKNKNRVNKYPSEDRLQTPIQVQAGNEILYRFEYE